MIARLARRQGLHGGQDHGLRSAGSCSTASGRIAPACFNSTRTGKRQADRDLDKARRSSRGLPSVERSRSCPIEGRHRRRTSSAASWGCTGKRLFAQFEGGADRLRELPFDTRCEKSCFPGRTGVPKSRMAPASLPAWHLKEPAARRSKVAIGCSIHKCGGCVERMVGPAGGATCWSSTVAVRPRRGRVPGIRRGSSD